MPYAKIYADFNNLDNHNRLKLTCSGTIADLAHQGIALEEGLTLTFYMDDADDSGEPDELLADGVVHYDEVECHWVASVDWSALRHASDERTAPVNGPASSVPAATAKDGSANQGGATAGAPPKLRG
jgi:hypothetical protein